MTYIEVYKICIVISCMLEIYLAFNFYKAFYKIRYYFQSKYKLYIGYFIIVLVNVAMNLRQSNIINIFIAAFLYLLIVLVFFHGKLWDKIIHWLMIFFLAASAEMIFSLLQKLSVDVPVDKAFKNEFSMISSILTIKIIYFLMLSIVKEFSKYSTEKLEIKLFIHYIIVPIASIGIMFAIPYVRGEKVNSGMDILLIFFYILLLIGNVSLFYVFSKYSKIKEYQMMQEISKVKYMEVKKHYESIERLDHKYKEIIHDMNYYLKQIWIYTESNETEKIKDVLSELQIEFAKGKKERICANDFLNALLIEFKERSAKEQVDVEIFVENGYKIEFLKEMELTVLLGNLFDNALEASKRCEVRKVYVTMFMQNRGLFSVIRIENTYEGAPHKKNGLLLSTKKDMEKPHGIGLQNVKAIIEKHNGYMQQEYSDGVFETTVIFGR